MRIVACRLRILTLAGATLVCSAVAPFAMRADDSGAAKANGGAGAPAASTRRHPMTGGLWHASGSNRS